MTPELAAAVADAAPTVIVGLLAAVAGIVVARLNKGGARENALIDQLQEQVNALGKSHGESLQRERIRDDYIHELRDHIGQHKPPPPPAWPEGLTR